MEVVSFWTDGQPVILGLQTLQVHTYKKVDTCKYCWPEIDEITMLNEKKVPLMLKESDGSSALGSFQVMWFMKLNKNSWCMNHAIYE